MKPDGSFLFLSFTIDVVMFKLLGRLVLLGLFVMMLFCGARGREEKRK